MIIQMKILIIGAVMKQPKLIIDRLVLLFDLDVLKNGFSHDVNGYQVDNHTFDSTIFNKEDYTYLGKSQNFEHHYINKYKLNIQHGPSRKKKVRGEDNIIPLSNGQGCLIEKTWNYIDQGYNLRVEYNPSRKPHQLMRSGEFSTLFKFSREINRLNPTNIKVGRVDYAIDYENYVDICSVTTTRSRKWSMFGGIEGVETLNLGTRSSDIQCVIYNKKKQKKEKLGQDTSSEHLYRFEYRNTKGFNLYDDDSAHENLYKNVMILGDVDTSEMKLRRGEQWHLELAKQYCERIKNPYDSLTLAEVEKRLNLLDKSNGRPVKKFILKIIKQSEKTIPYTHPAKIFERDAKEVWNKEREKIETFLELRG